MMTREKMCSAVSLGGRAVGTDPSMGTVPQGDVPSLKIRSDPCSNVHVRMFPNMLKHVQCMLCIKYHRNSNYQFSHHFVPHVGFPMTLDFLSWRAAPLMPLARIEAAVFATAPWKQRTLQHTRCMVASENASN